MSYVTPGSVILVTGATGGIGIEIAAQVAESGAIVGVHGSRMETVSKAMEKIKSRAAKAKLIAVPGDFQKPGVAAEVVDKVVTEAGRLDAVIHCAITAAPEITGILVKTNPANFRLAVGNVLGIFQELCFAAMPHLAKQGGTIVGFASDAGRFAAPRQTIVGSAFGGVMTFVRNLAMEAARDKVRVHCISPSYVEDTPVFDVHVQSGRPNAARDRAKLGLPTPKDIAPITLFLCGPGATKMTGQIISINGGLNT